MVAGLVVFGAFAAYFLITGVRALTTGRITVVNANNRGAWPGLLGAAMWRMRTPPPPDTPTGFHVEATGSEARGRGILHIVLGAALAAAAIAMLVMG